MGLQRPDTHRRHGDARHIQILPRPDRLPAWLPKAGNDILELVRDPKEAIDSIYAAVQKGQISKKQIEESVRRILAIKYYVRPEQIQTDKHMEHRIRCELSRIQTSYPPDDGKDDNRTAEQRQHTATRNRQIQKNSRRIAAQ